MFAELHNFKVNNYGLVHNINIYKGTLKIRFTTGEYDNIFFNLRLIESNLFKPRNCAHKTVPPESWIL